MKTRKFAYRDTQKGAASGLAMLIIVLVLIAVAGVGFFWYRAATKVAVNPDNQLAAVGNATSTGYTYTIGEPGIPDTGNSENSTTQTPNSSSGTVVKKIVTTTVSNPVRQPARVTSAYGGPVYHNSVYGLTIPLPAGWEGYRVYETTGGQNGLPGNATFHFVAPGSTTDTFAVTVYSKEQWNAIRTTENYAHANTPNLGEGQYLGENFTWIYSANIFQNSPDIANSLATAVFY